MMATYLSLTLASPEPCRILTAHMTLEKLPLNKWEEKSSSGPQKRK